MVADRERGGNAGEGGPVPGSEDTRGENPAPAGSDSLPHGALDETLPSDRAGWDAADAGPTADSPGAGADRAT